MHNITHKNKDRATQTPRKTRGELMCSEGSIAVAPCHIRHGTL